METPQEDGGRKMGSRALRELKNLTPWMWDTKSKHPPGKATLRDFEKVEEAFMSAGGSVKTRGESSKAHSVDGVTPGSVGQGRGHTGKRDASLTGSRNVQQTPGTVQGTARRVSSGGSTGRKRLAPDVTPLPASAGHNNHTPALLNTEQIGGQQGLAAALGFTTGNATLLLGPQSAGGAAPMGPPSGAADMPGAASAPAPAGIPQHLPPAATPYTSSKRVRISGGGLASSLLHTGGVGAAQAPDCTPLPGLRGAPTPQPPRHMLLDPAVLGPWQRNNQGPQGHALSAQKLSSGGSLGRTGLAPAAMLGCGRGQGSHQQGQGISSTPAVQRSSSAGLISDLPPMAHALAAALGVDHELPAAVDSQASRGALSTHQLVPAATPHGTQLSIHKTPSQAAGPDSPSASAPEGGALGAASPAAPGPSCDALAPAADPAPRLAAALTLMDVARMAATPSTCHTAPQPRVSFSLGSRQGLATTAEQEPTSTPAAPRGLLGMMAADGGIASAPRATGATLHGSLGCSTGQRPSIIVSGGGVPSTPGPTPAPPAKPSGCNPVDHDMDGPMQPAVGRIAETLIAHQDDGSGQQPSAVVPAVGSTLPEGIVAAGSTDAAAPMEVDPQGQPEALQQGVLPVVGNEGVEVAGDRDGIPEQELLQMPVFDPAAVVVAAALAAVVAKAATPASVPRHVSKTGSAMTRLATIAEEEHADGDQQLQHDTAGQCHAIESLNSAIPQGPAVAPSSTLAAPLVHPTPLGTTQSAIPAGTVVTTLPPGAPLPAPASAPTSTTSTQGQQPKGLGNASPLRLQPRPALRGPLSRLRAVASNTSVAAAPSAPVPEASASAGHQGGVSTGGLTGTSQLLSGTPFGTVQEGMAAAGQGASSGPKLPPLALAPAAAAGAIPAPAGAPAAAAQGLPFPVLHRRTSSNGGSGSGKGKAQGSTNSTLDAQAQGATTETTVTTEATGKAGKNGSVRQLLRAQLQRQQQAAALAASATVAATAAAAALNVAPAVSAPAPAAAPAAMIIDRVTMPPGNILGAGIPHGTEARLLPSMTLSAVTEAAATTAAAAGTNAGGANFVTVPCADAEDEAMMDAALALAAVSSSPPLNTTSLPGAKSGVAAKQCNTQAGLKSLAVQGDNTAGGMPPWAAAVESAMGGSASVAAAPAPAALRLQAPLLDHLQQLPPLASALQQQQQYKYPQQQQQQPSLYGTPNPTTSNSAAQMSGLLAAYSKPVPVCNSPGGLASVGDLNAAGTSSLFMSHTQHPGLVGLSFQEVVKLVSAYCMALDIPPTSENVQQAQQVVSLLRASNTSAALSVLQRLQQQAGHSTKLSASSTGLLTITPLILLDKPPVDHDWCATLRPEVTEVYAALVSSHKALREACQLGNASATNTPPPATVTAPIQLSNAANISSNTAPALAAAAAPVTGGSGGSEITVPAPAVALTATTGATAGTAAPSLVPPGLAFPPQPPAVNTTATTTAMASITPAPAANEVTCGSPFAAAHHQSTFAVLETTHTAAAGDRATAAATTAGAATAAALASAGIVHPSHSISATSTGGTLPAVQSGSTTSLAAPLPSLAPASSVATPLTCTAGLPPRAPSNTAVQGATAGGGTAAGTAFAFGKPPLPPAQPTRPPLTAFSGAAAGGAGWTGAGVPASIPAPSSFARPTPSQQHPPSLALENSTASITLAGASAIPPASSLAAQPQPVASTTSVALTRSSSVNSYLSVTAAGMLPGGSTGSQCVTSNNNSADNTAGGCAVGVSTGNTGTASTVLTSTASLSRLSTDSAGTFPGFQPVPPAAGAALQDTPKPIPHHALPPVQQSVTSSLHSIERLGPLAQALLQAQYASTPAVQPAQSGAPAGQLQGMQGNVNLVSAGAGGASTTSTTLMHGSPLPVIGTAPQAGDPVPSDASVAVHRCSSNSSVMPMAWESGSTLAAAANTTQSQLQVHSPGGHGQQSLPTIQGPQLQPQVQGTGAGVALSAGSLFGPGGLASSVGGLQFLMLQQLQQQQQQNQVQQPQQQQQQYNHHHNVCQQYQQQYQRVQGPSLDLSGIPSAAALLASTGAAVGTGVVDVQGQGQQHLLLEGAPSLAAMLR